MKYKDDFGRPYRLEDIKACVGVGWHGIIDDLVKELEKLGWDGTVAQVKEKFGGLRFYIGGIPKKTSKKIFRAIDEAERKSVLTCEYCGKPGKLRTERFWILTLCNECNEKEPNH
jgi:hypothetical protein